MPERNPAGFKAAPHFEGWKSDYDKVTVKIQNPIQLSEIPDGGLCPCCGRPSHKAYLDWEITSNLYDKGKLIVTVCNTAGYMCEKDCSMMWPSHAGVLQNCDQVLPVFEERGFRRTVQAIRWTKRVLLETILPTQYSRTDEA